jgi:hypothetical protein
MGCKKWEDAAYAAARQGHVSCLGFLLKICDDLREVDLVGSAARHGKLETVMFLVEAGFRMDSSSYIGAASSGNLDLLRYVLQGCQNPAMLERLMWPAMESGNHECVKLLYRKGYNQQSFTYDSHPALLAIKYGMLESLRYVVPRTPPPSRGLLRYGLDGADAVRGGLEMLQYVHGLGCKFDESVAAFAVREGNLGALQYLHSIGTPWSVMTLAVAVAAGSLQCLAYAHTHGCPQDPSGLQGCPVRPVAKKLDVLRYVCEHMEPTWAATVLGCTTTFLEGSVERIEGVGWRFVAYLERKREGALPENLAHFLAPQKEEAAALAGVFWKARRLTEGGPDEWRVIFGEGEFRAAKTSRMSNTSHVEVQEKVALWESLAKVPIELRERIALDADFIYR